MANDCFVGAHDFDFTADEKKRTSLKRFLAKKKKIAVTQNTQEQISSEKKKIIPLELHL